MREEYLSIILAGSEERNREYKQSFPWDRTVAGPTMAKVTKTILAMSNLQDGGHIVIGVMEQESLQPCKPEGVTEDHLKTYSYDKIADFVQKYAEPYVSFGIEPVSHNGLNFIVIAVEGFDEYPVICKNSYDNILAQGTVYIRPKSGKPQSAPLTNYRDMRELLDLATQRGIRRFLETQVRVNVPNNDDVAEFKRQIEDFS